MSKAKRASWDSFAAHSLPSADREPGDTTMPRLLNFDDLTAAAVAFEGRWTYAALRRVNPELYARFKDQQSMYWNAVAGSDEIEKTIQGRAMVRGYIAIFKAMEDQPHDAYVICQSGDLQIAIGQNVAPAYVVPDGVVYLTMDEVAQLLNEIPGFSEMAKIKSLFPGSVVAPADNIEGWAL